jgi:hypothetical protein
MQQIRGGFVWKDRKSLAQLQAEAAKQRLTLQRKNERIQADIARTKEETSNRRHAWQADEYPIYQP